jgi:subtilisin-like proprotein convertase family protein
MKRRFPRFWAIAALLFGPIAVQAAPPLHPASGALTKAIRSARAQSIHVDSEGVLRDAWDLDLDAGTDPAALLTESAVAPSPESRVELVEVRESLVGRHLRFQQVIDGAPVVDGEATLDVDNDGKVRELHNRFTRAVRLTPLRAPAESAEALAAATTEIGGARIESVSAVWLQHGDHLVAAFRLVARSNPFEPYAYYVDATTGAVIRSHPLFATASAKGRVFDPNPVSKLRDPLLRDHDDAASAVPDAAYSIVDLFDLPDSGPLVGPNVAIVDVEDPLTTPADASQSLMFDRSQPQFEDVNTYFHLDRSQRYLQSLGYVGARRIIAQAVRVDAHAVGGRDESFYVSDPPGAGVLHFGTGGTDDAEDSDILLHEYGHAIQDSIASGVFLATAGGRAIGEGFGDYWAFSSNYKQTVVAGSDPFCLAPWDARCAGDDPSSRCGYPEGADCLRRVDGTKTMADYVAGEDSAVDHSNGEIWSSALREIFVNLVTGRGVDDGRRMADTIVIESHFGAPPAPTFDTMARKMIAADVLLDHGAAVPVICSAMTARGILAQQDCSASPRGELTLYQSTDRALAIPDGDPRGMTSQIVITDPRSIDHLSVSVDIQHPYIGDLRITLRAPDGTAIVLVNSSPSVAAHDLRVTFGSDAQPAQSLDALHGRPAAGLWTLEIVDISPNDAGTLRSWSLVIQYIGDAPLTSRPLTAAGRKHIAAVASTPGAEGTRFVSDVRILNRGPVAVNVMAIFTPSGMEGNSNFSAVHLAIASQQIVALDDVVTQTFHSAGTGNLEFEGNVASLLSTSRTYNATTAGTYGQFIPSQETGEAAGAGIVLVIPQLRNDDEFRSNIGFTEVAGRFGSVAVDLFDASHRLLQHSDYGLLPFAHGQVPILGGRAGEYHDAVLAELRVSGEAAILAYGSVVDNRSGDPIYVPARQVASGPSVLIVPAVVHGDGANGTRWRSDLWLTNRGPAQTVVVRYDPAAGGPGITRQVPLADGEMRGRVDVLSTLFDLAAGAGHLTITAPGPILVTSRTWAPSDSGSFGQFIPAREATQSVTAVSPGAEAIQVESTDEFRTNVGAVEITGQPVVVRFALVDDSGRTIALSDQALAPFGLSQLNVRQFAAAGAINGRVMISVASGNGRVIGYASVIDNRTGDPIFIPAQ